MNENNKKQINQNKNCLSNRNFNIPNKNVFITQIINIPSNVNIKNDTEKLNDNVCPYCHWTFCSNFSMRRHRDNTHLNKNLMNCPICKKPFRDLKKHMKTCDMPKKINSKAIESANFKNNKEISEKQIVEKVLEQKKNNIYLSEINNNKYNNLVIENQQDSFSIYSNKALINENINNIIIKNFYNILNEHEYFSLNNYFILKHFVLGQGKYGTVWFGLDVKNANAVAIKAQNNTTSDSSFDLEISVMNKLRKYKIFSILFNKFYVNNKVYLIETLHLPTIEKFKTFCESYSFSIISVLFFL